MKISLCCGLGGALLFGVMAVVFSGGDLFWALAAAVIGLLLGLLAAPEFEPKAFRHAALYQCLCGALAGGLIGGWLTASAQTGLMAAAIGALLGWLAPRWLHHVQGP
ncbi:hypothetical protein [Bordetella sp. N]|uniref:hypothetical protein n=1 Tax=Bordetella sp. N TaxID=1746199 RepID=UPI00070E146A|nr:hypothetical protein [Bordetella sp. N]ALM86598.1 hypothetical protein ASB57_29995 [Bordetella sp. N]